MKESIITTVFDPTDGNDMEVMFLFSGDSLDIIDMSTEKVLFSGDWSANFAPLFERALELWPVIEMGDLHE